MTTTNHVWKREDVGTFVPTPVAYQGRVYLVRDRGEVECIDPVTGKTIWGDAFPKSSVKFYASPLIAGGNLYAPREDGVVFVAAVTDDKFKLLAENDMDWKRTKYRNFGKGIANSDHSRIARATTRR